MRAFACGSVALRANESRGLRGFLSADSNPREEEDEGQEEKEIRPEHDGEERGQRNAAEVLSPLGRGHFSQGRPKRLNGWAKSEARMTGSLDSRYEAAGVHVGDTVRLAAPGRVDEGVLMPRHAFSATDVAILKLASGYNVGVRVSEKTTIELVRRGVPAATPTRPVPAAGAKPSIALLGTGGTIASYVDYRTGAVHPAATAEDLAFATPEIFEFANVRAEKVFQVFSEDLTPENWLELAKRVKAAFDGGARGVVIPHGTDTLGFTAAALAFLLRDLPGPVVLVGAQRSSDRPSSDAATNLVAACRLAASADLGEVVACLHESSSDLRIAIHRGVRVRKNHSSRRDAFKSINAAPLGFVEGDRISLTQAHRARSEKPCRAYAKIASDVALVHSYPGLTGEALERIITGRGAVIAGTGLGHLPNRTLEAVQRLTNRGALLVMATQTLWGRVDMKVYSTGRDLFQRGVVPASDMIPETAYVKLCWALANASSRDEAAEWMRTDQAGEMEPRTLFEAGAGSGG